ncbi:hypothetical protein GQ42DRAFT_161823 [Ramicandelaber brevisporus]|nr:hypothetical protein GQ42DRAFT_161823 [Ramicandelaber brevisporus]
MLLEKIKAKSQRGWRSLTRIFASRSSQPEQPEQPSRRPRVDGRLFVLPYDLLEEIATYFSRQEAALLLTVNSQFHDAFARAIWHRLYLNDDRVDRISASAWETYGHLVRFATVDFCEPHEHLDVVRMPNVVDLTLYLTYRGYNIFEGAELSNLRRLHLNLPWQGWTSFAAIKGAELAQRIGQPDHPISVDWDIHAEKHKQVAAIDEILAPITNMSSHSFNVIARLTQSAHLKHISKLAEMLTELDTYSSAFAYGSFLGDPSISFPRLVKLDFKCVDVGEIGPVDAYALTPNRLPVLQHLTLANLLISDFEWLEALFSHDWSSITELAFINSSTPLEVAIVANCVPYLRRLVVNGFGCSLNINQAAVYWSRLQHLEVDNNVQIRYDVSNNPRSQLANLKSFIFDPARKMSQCFVRQHILEFLLHGAPNLESIELKESCFAKKTLRAGRNRVNPSVRTLDIEIGLHRFDTVTTKMFIGMFPNLKLLKVKSKDGTASQQLKEGHPNLRIHCYQ